MQPNLTRRQFQALVAGGAAVALAPVLSAVDSDGGVIFPFGTHVYREPSLPLEQFAKDFPILKRLGFNMVKLQEVWAYDERHEGEVNLEKVAHIISDARQNGLKVYLGLTMENAPGWLWKKFPDAYMVYEDGSQHRDPTPYVLPADGKPGPCWHHPGARAAAAKFIETLGRELGKYDNILIWNVFQEIGFWPDRPGHLGFCFCPYTLAEFRQWLRKKYGTIDSLNDTWNSPYGDWEEIEPPRFSPMVPPTIDWRYFMDDVSLTESLKWKADAFRRGDPQQRPVFAHVGGITVGGTREWRYARALDKLGMSCYPAWGGMNSWDKDHAGAGKPAAKHASLYHELWEGVLMHCDYLRSASPSGDIWAAELQGGAISNGFKLGRTPDAADIRRWVLGLLASGVRGVSFWNHRPEIFWQEINGFSLLDDTGDSSPRAVEAGLISKALNAHAEIFAKGERVRPDVAIVVNEDLFHWMEVSGDLRAHYEYTIRGIYKSLWDEGVGLDFLDANQIAAEGSRYKLLIQPLPMALRRNVMQSLQGFVRDGGTVVSEACPGRLSEYGHGYTGGMAPEMEELFGVESSRIANIREPQDGAKWSGEQRTDGDTIPYRELTGSGGVSLFPAYYLQTYRVRSAVSLFRYEDETAGVMNRYGKGRAYLIGTLLGHALTAYGDPRNSKFLASTAFEAGVKPDRIGLLLRRRRKLQDQEAWFLFNTGETPVEESVPLEGRRTMTDLFGSAVHVHAGSASVRVEPLDVRCLIVA